MSSLLGEGLGDATAVLADWEGHITVEHSTIALLGHAALRHPHVHLNTENYCRRAVTARRYRLNITDTDNDDDEDDDNSDDENSKVFLCSKHKNEDEGKVRNGKGNIVNEQCAPAINKRNQHSKRVRDIESNEHSSPNRTMASNESDGYGIERLSCSRLGPFSQQTTTGSSLFADSMTEIIDLQNEHEPTSALLEYCKRKFLRPFVAILTLIGLNPITTDTSIYHACISYWYATIILILLLCGYVLQYICSYRGDRGFSSHREDLYTDPKLKITHTVGQLLFGHIIPNTLHLCGFISAVIVFKIHDQEQLQNLIERVFLTSMKPRHLCRVLWMYILCGLVMIGFLFAYAVPSILMQTPIVQVKWLAEDLKDCQLAIKISLLTTIFLQDLVEIIILSSYCIECYLLRIHLATLSHKLLMHSIETLDWMREVLEFRKLLNHLNQRIAIPVCFFTIMNLAYAFASLIYLFSDFNFHYSALNVICLNIVNVLLWLLMGLVPFFLAASVTRVCQTAQANGHQIRVRPFVYHNTSADDLNSTLLFASSLDMSAKLFRMPVQPNYLCFALLAVSIIVLTLGMCLNLSAFGDF